MAIIKVKRGLASNLPATAIPGELIATLDTNILYMGNSTGDGLLQLTDKPHASNHLVGESDALPVATTSVPGLMSATDKTKLDGLNGEGGGMTLYRYNLGLANCSCLATGTGITATRPTSNNVVISEIPEGVVLLSMSIYFSLADLSGFSAYYIALPASAGFGVGAGYYCFQVISYKDVPGSRGPGGTISFNIAQSTVSVTGLMTNSAYVANIVF